MEVVVILASVAVFIISIFGILGNGISLRVAMTAADVKTTFSVLFILMLVADIAHLVLGIVLQMYVLISPEDNDIAALSAVLDLTNNIALLSVAGLAIDRYLALKKTSYFVHWNTPCGMTLTPLILVLCSCGKVAWASHMTLGPRCVSNTYGTFSYVATIVVAATTLGVKCVLTKWIVKLDTAVSDIQQQQQPNSAGQVNIRNIIHSFKAVQWVILEEVLASACLHSIVIAIIVHENRCLSHVASLWWYQLVQVTSKADKPFILLLVSKHFRESAVQIFSRHVCHRPRSLFDSDEDLNTAVPAPSNPRCRDDNASTFAVTSVDSNQLACVRMEDQIANSVVATFQGRRYPFKRSVESQFEAITLQNHPPVSQSSSSSMIDDGSLVHDSAFSSNTYQLGFRLQDPLPNQDSIQSLVSQKGRNFNYHFELIMRKRSETTISCPDLKAAHDAIDLLDNQPRTRKRCSIGSSEAKSNRPKVMEARSPYHLPPLVHRGFLHPGTMSGSECRNNSVLTCRNDNGSNDSIYTMSDFPLSVQEPIQGRLSRQNSMCNLVRKENSMLSLTSINDIPNLTPETTNGCVHSQVQRTAVSDVARSPRHSMPDIVLINDKYISTQVLLNSSAKSHTEMEIPAESKQMSTAGSSSSNPHLVSQNEQRETRGTSNNLHNICSVEIENDCTNETRRCGGSQRRSSKSGGRRYSLQDSPNQAHTTKHRHASESIRDPNRETLEALQTCKKTLAMTPRLLHVSAFARPSSLNIAMDSHEYPPELKLAFVTPRQSMATDDGRLFTFADSEKKELTFRNQLITRGSLPHAVDTPPSEYNPVLNPLTSRLKSVDIVSNLSSPCTSPMRKLSDSVYDPDSHVYLGTHSALPIPQEEVE